MSNIGKIPIKLPQKFEVVSIKDNVLELKTLKDKIKFEYDSKLNLEYFKNNHILKVDLKVNDKKLNNIWGTTRNQLQNFIQGHSQGFYSKIYLKGIGYKLEFSTDKTSLILYLGFSHKIIKPIPKEISCKILHNTELLIFGSEKQKVTQFAAEIRKCKAPDVYKGKGVLYENENIKLKESKKK